MGTHPGDEGERRGGPPHLGPAADAARLPEILLESLTALVEAGEVETACRLAGRACVALRHSDPAASRRFDVLLHRLTRRLDW